VRMGQGRDDLAALLRCWRSGVGLPAAVSYGWRMFAPLTDAYEIVVAPIVAQAVGDPRERSRINRALRAMSVKIGETMVSYACLAGCGPQPDIAALAGAITRLYDDLIDGCPSDDESLDDRLRDLFSARPFAPDNDLERLLARLVGEIRHRLDLQDGDIAVTALLALHEYQCLSRRQRDAGVPSATLDKICRGKGAMANLTWLIPGWTPVSGNLSWRWARCSSRWTTIWTSR
jgi:hypothetical protein